jgi:hypothetical protein
MRPVSARSGRKEFINAQDERDELQGDTVLSADTVAP